MNRPPFPHGPQIAVHIEPFTDGEARLSVGAQGEHVAIEIFALHFAGPGVVGGRIGDFGAPAFAFFEEGFQVADADPDPRARIPLVTFAQEGVATIARD